MDIQAEEWRTIPSFPDYSASSLGRIRRDTHSPSGFSKPGRILKQTKRQNGYHFKVTLWRDGTRRDVSVHRAVAEAFLPPPPDSLAVVMHINEESAYPNAAANLMWGTPKENVEDSLRKGRWAIGSRSGNAKLTEQDVAVIRRDHPQFSQRQLAQRYGVTKTAIRSVLHRKSWAHVA